jgi:hypothetical protein
VSHHTIEELIEFWKHEKLTAEQAIGQILHVLREHERHLREGARRPPASNSDPADAAGGPPKR